MSSSISSIIAKEMKKVFGNKTNVVTINILYSDEIDKYVLAIDEAHMKAGNSVLKFV